MRGTASFYHRFSIQNWLGLKEGILPQVLSIFIYVNLVWTLLNLLPVQPLDGGRLLSIVLEGMFGLKGIKISFFFKHYYFCGFGSFLFLWSRPFSPRFDLRALFAFESYRSWQTTMALSQEDQNVSIQTKLRQAEALLRER